MARLRKTVVWTSTLGNNMPVKMALYVCFYFLSSTMLTVILLFNVANAPKNGAIQTAIIILIDAAVIAYNFANGIELLPYTKPWVFLPSILRPWLHQRFYEASSTSLMARDMLSQGFGKTNDKLVVVLSTRTVLGGFTLGIWIKEMNLILLDSKIGKLGPAGVLHVMLHEVTHAAGFSGHRKDFRVAYVKAGLKFKWFNKISGPRFGRAEVEADRVVYPGVN